MVYQRHLLVEPVSQTILAWWDYDNVCPFFFGKDYLKRNTGVDNQIRWVKDATKNPFKKADKPPGNKIDIIFQNFGFMENYLPALLPVPPGIALALRVQIRVGSGQVEGFFLH